MTFTKENIEDLRSICQRTDKLLSEHVDGALMLSQMIMLGDRIKEFIANPIVRDSGLVGISAWRLKQLAKELVGDYPADMGDPEYIRGVCELIADVDGRPDMHLPERAVQVAEAMGISNARNLFYE